MFGKPRGVCVALSAVMDPTEFDRLIARVRDPRLVPGIYNYCDGRCPRCPFTERCLVFLDHADANGGRDESTPIDVTPTDAIGASLQRTIEMLAEVARREGVDVSAAAGDDDVGSIVSPDHEDDPLVARAREYSTLAWRVSRALAPVVAVRGDAAAIEAVETIEWFSSQIAAKLYRAVCGQGDAWAHDDVQTDYDGSAKIALIGIRESRAAWLTLMEAGKATADGVPAQAAKTLDDLDSAIRVRFPRAEQFVRPGFDEPAVAAGGPATLPPWSRRPPPASR
jgi:hypothetical protein